MSVVSVLEIKLYCHPTFLRLGPGQRLRLEHESDLGLVLELKLRKVPSQKSGLFWTLAKRGRGVKALSGLNWSTYLIFLGQKWGGKPCPDYFPPGFQKYIIL